MFEISYFALFFIIVMMMGISGGLVALLFKKIEKKTPKQVTIICDYKTSKDYDRLYKLLNDGQTVLVRSCVKKWVLADHFYSSFKSSCRDNEYYICCGPTEYLPTKEKFIYYCKFKEIEFLDFIV